MDTEPKTHTEAMTPLVASLETMAHFRGGSVTLGKEQILALKRIIAKQAQHLDHQAKLIGLYESMVEAEELLRKTKRRMMIDFLIFGGCMALIGLANVILG